MGLRREQAVTVLDDLDELQFVSKLAYRQGYVALFEGRPRRLTYAKIMDIDGGVLVYRPAMGRERPKRVPRISARDLLLLAVCAWPVTLVAVLVVVSLVRLGIRALLHG